MCSVYVYLSLITVVVGAATDTYKDQFCTDPRTMNKHAAYSEWPDSYSCTRHRCQPGGRNLAIYTVGCKRVEAPESAIECEEVVEDTNMQFPFCCTRLRCLVVVRGEVWTRVLGQPWETLPAAPWSHMYKMKKPPPGENAFVNKNAEQGPVYELLQTDHEKEHDKVLRAAKKSSSTADGAENVARAVPSPDIVIALATTNDEKKNKNDNARHKKPKSSGDANDVDEDDKEHIEIDMDDTPVSEKAVWAAEIPQSHWNVHDPSMDIENQRTHADKTAKPSGLQALVDAIGNRMRDIESVVQKMSDKVHNKPENEIGSGERNETPKTHPKTEDKVQGKEEVEKEKKPSSDNEHYKRFIVKNRGSKYLRSNDATSEPPGFVEDSGLNGYFSDASNSVGRRTNGAPKEPGAAPTYVAPVENRRKSHDLSEEDEKKHKKHTHKKKRKGKGHKKRHNKEDKKKHVNRLVSAELDRNVVSLEDSAPNV